MDQERLRLSAACLAAAERLHDGVWLSLALGFGSLYLSAWGEWQSPRELSARGLALAPKFLRKQPNSKLCVEFLSCQRVP